MNLFFNKFFSIIFTTRYFIWLTTMVIYGIVVSKLVWYLEADVVRVFMFSVIFLLHNKIFDFVWNYFKKAK